MQYSQEQYDLMAQFEKTYRYGRLDREPKSFWLKGIIYQDGEVNKLFLAYQQGYALGKHKFQQAEQAAEAGGE